MSADDLILSHLHIARMVARDYFLLGCGHDDVEQEAMIGLVLAARSYKSSAGVPFSVFARIVIRRKLGQMVRKHTTGKSSMLTNALRFGDGDLPEAFHIPPDPRGSAHDEAERREHVRNVIDACRSLTDLERSAIANSLNGIPVDKQADNALYRARKKLRAAA